MLFALKGKSLKRAIAFDFKGKSPKRASTLDLKGRYGEEYVFFAYFCSKIDFEFMFKIHWLWLFKASGNF